MSSGNAGKLNGIRQTYTNYIYHGRGCAWGAGGGEERELRSSGDPLSVINDICSQARRYASGHCLFFACDWPALRMTTHIITRACVHFRLIRQNKPRKKESLPGPIEVKCSYQASMAKYTLHTLSIPKQYILAFLTNLRNTSWLLTAPLRAMGRNAAYRLLSQFWNVVLCTRWYKSGLRMRQGQVG